MNPLAAATAELIALGVTGDALIGAISRMEQAMYVDRIEKRRSAGAERQARYAERKRQKASESVTTDVTDISSVSDSLSLPLSPQTPLSPTHTHGDINTHARKADREPDGFAAFWEVYPRRVGKDAARKAYAKATRKASLAELIDAVRRDMSGQWRDRPPDMIPHPATWLNQARWEDEPPPETTHITPRSTHERPSRQAAQLDERYENYRRALAGAEIAAQRRAVEPSGGF